MQGIDGVQARRVLGQQKLLCKRDGDSGRVGPEDGAVVEEGGDHEEGVFAFDADDVDLVAGGDVGAPGGGWGGADHQLGALADEEDDFGGGQDSGDFGFAYLGDVFHFVLGDFDGDGDFVAGAGGLCGGGVGGSVGGAGGEREKKETERKCAAKHGRPILRR